MDSQQGAANARILSEEEARDVLVRWMRFWNEHDLEQVLDLMAEDVVFEHWTGARIVGKRSLRRAWKPWFQDHGGFHFTVEEVFVDEKNQKVLCRWELEWPSPEERYTGQPERRWGTDILHFRDGKIVQKLTYSKTVVEIAGKQVTLAAVV